MRISRIEYDTVCQSIESATLADVFALLDNIGELGEINLLGAKSSMTITLDGGSYDVDISINEMSKVHSISLEEGMVLYDDMRKIIEHFFNTEMEHPDYVWELLEFEPKLNKGQDLIN